MPSNPPDFSRQHFKTPDVVDNDWLAWFREEFSRNYSKIETTPKDDVPFALNGVGRALPDVYIYRGTCSPSRSRNMAELTADDDPVISVGISGDMALQLGDKEVILEPGKAIVLQNDAPVVMTQHSVGSFLSIRLRRRLLAPLVKDLSSLQNLPQIVDQQALRLLLGYVNALEREETISSPELQHLVTTGIHELAALAIGATRDTEESSENRGKRAGRMAAIKTDIFANLTSPRLSVAAVAARHGLTARYVQMLFEADGITFSEFVLQQRLASAYRMLSDPRHAGRAIHDIALQAGFGDLSYFNRSFRRRFGMTPSDARKLSTE